VEKGNCSTSQSSFLHFSDDLVVGNLKVVGVSLGSNSYSVLAAVSRVKEVELERLQGLNTTDFISEVFDKEEKEEVDNQEIDKLLLNSLCCDIMDDVMDLGNAYPSDGKITPRQKPSSSLKANNKSASKKKHKKSK
jgi:hypothetical protein